jgi:hypothetical protein
MASILTSLMQDEVRSDIQQDPLMNLLKVETNGGTWKTRKVKDLLRAKLRYASRILVEMRKELPETTMFDALQVKHFDLIVEATCRCAMDANGVESFETRIKMGQVLSPLHEEAKDHGIENNEHGGRGGNRVAHEGL